MESTDIKFFIPKNSKKKTNANRFYLISIVLIIFIFLFFLFSLKFMRKNCFYNKYNYNYFFNEFGNYSLYNLFKYPQITILIPNFNEWNFNKNEIKNFIKSFENQSFKEIQILIYLNNIEDNLLTNYSLTDDRIHILKLKKFYFENLENLVFNIKGKYTIIMDEYINFEKDDLKKFYFYTRGKINNIFKFKKKNSKDVYLIKSKILRDIIDTRKTVHNINELLNYIISIPEPKLNYISIAFCIDNYYSSLAYTAMSSILNSKDINTYISFYIIISKIYTQNNIYFLESLYEEYDLFNITFIKMDNRYDKAYINRYLTKQTYYRCSLGEIIPYLNRIIYLDPDIVVYKDLTNLYNMNFNGKIILGQLSCINKSKKTGIYNINMGVLLLNLKKMRKIKMEKKVLSIINKGYKSDYHDQYLINHYFSKYIGNLPPEYNTRPFKNYEDIINYNNRSGNLYDTDYLYYSWKYPAIRHYLGHSKPTNYKATNIDDWWFFARKSKYFNKRTNNLSNIFNFTYA